MRETTPAQTQINYERLYAYRFRGIDQSSRQAVWNEIARYIYDEMGRPTRVLDPAAGRCEFINAIPATERWIVDQVDYAEAWRAPDVRVIVADALEAELPPGHFDGVFVSNFLEHLLSQEQVAKFLSTSFHKYSDVFLRISSKFCTFVEPLTCLATLSLVEQAFDANHRA